jgi:hypothetical protein
VTVKQTRLTTRDLPGTSGERPVQQCCVSVDTTIYNKWYQGKRAEKTAQINQEWDPSRCIRAAVVEIDGQHYCRLHAGSEALDRWLDGRLVEAQP